VGLNDAMGILGVAAGLAGVVYARSQRNDARNFRRMEDMRRAEDAEAGKEAEAAQAAAASKKLRYGKDIDAALTFLATVEEATTKILGGVLLSKRKMNQINLTDYARKAEVLAGRLPDGKLFSRKDRGIAYLIDELVKHPFDDSLLPTTYEVYGKMAIAQYVAAQDLEQAIVTARERLRDELG
jgi:hypothetical protein